MSVYGNIINEKFSLFNKKKNKSDKTKSLEKAKKKIEKWIQIYHSGIKNFFSENYSFDDLLAGLYYIGIDQKSFESLFKNAKEIDPLDFLDDIDDLPTKYPKLAKMMKSSPYVIIYNDGSGNYFIYFPKENLIYYCDHEENDSFEKYSFKRFMNYCKNEFDILDKNEFENQLKVAQKMIKN